jgi:hypothetical protein
MARLAAAGSRVGYSLVVAAVVAFVIAMLTSFDFWGPVVIACLALTTVTLAPAMVLGYAVKAAAREDRERGIS